MNSETNQSRRSGNLRLLLEGTDGRRAARYLLHDGDLSRPSDAQTRQLKRDGLQIGRSSENDIALSSPVVSRHHALLVADLERISVIDLGSGNGTYVDGRRIEPGQPAPLHMGSEISFGHGATLTLSM